MPLIDVDDVQPWLEESKLRLDSADELPEEKFQSEYVLSRLASCLVDASSWIDPAATPPMIRWIIGMLVAAQRYNKAYSETEDSAGNLYANKLEDKANMLIDGICSGDLLIDAIAVDVSIGEPSFYPTDLTGILPTETEESVRFTMGRVF